LFRFGKSIRWMDFHIEEYYTDECSYNMEN
jgi:hypothetical protein